MVIAWKKTNSCFYKTPLKEYTNSKNKKFKKPFLHLEKQFSNMITKV